MSFLGRTGIARAPYFHHEMVAQSAGTRALPRTF
jgi:hypothetical protein